jgi:FkbM family methyltransferase
MVPAKLNGEYDIILPEHRAARPEWYTKQGWERARLASMHKTTQKDDIVYYIGSEEGEMCALLQGWGARLVMFEPNALVWPNVKAIWEANKLGQPLIAFPGFASSETRDLDTSDIRAGFPDCANGEVISNHGFKNLCEADGTVPQIKIDDMVIRTGHIPDMITFDVEGADWEVLKGAEQTLIKYHPRIYASIHPEFMYEIYKVYSHDFREWVKALGYRETILDYQHELHALYEATDV